ncbi:MAG: hypothetical protein IH987_02205 [Planctomycetes bacterium]|nr:hypothetical protein [Planctomycetota bacterium]
MVSGRANGVLDELLGRGSIYFGNSHGLANKDSFESQLGTWYLGTVSFGKPTIGEAVRNEDEILRKNYELRID